MLLRPIAAAAESEGFPGGREQLSHQSGGGVLPGEAAPREW